MPEWERTEKAAQRVELPLTANTIGTYTDEGLRRRVRDSQSRERLKPVAAAICREYQTRDDWRDQEFCATVAEPAIESIDDRALHRDASRVYQYVLRCALAEALRRKKVEAERRSLITVPSDMEKAYALINRVGRGLVYFGSSRTTEWDSEYLAGMELAYEAALLLDVPTWTGGGPGQMEAPIRGALQAGKRMGAIKIMLSQGEKAEGRKEATTPYLHPGLVVECRHFAPRKIGLVDAGVRVVESDRTAYIFFPGGLGTQDEFFEIATLDQMQKLGSNYSVPILLMNYDGFYNGLMDWLRAHPVRRRMLSPEELERIQVCPTNLDALEHLADFYDIPETHRWYRQRLLLPLSITVNPNGARLLPLPQSA
jgi:predicted Rossmann-fold nucleotide-binding protein